MAALKAFESGNAGGMWPLVPDVERTAYGLDREKLQRLMDACDFKRALQPAGKYLVEESPSTGSVDVARWYKAHGTVPALISIRAEIHEEHAVFVRNPVTSLIHTFIFVEGARDGPAPKPLTRLRGLRRVERRLSELGFGGVIVGDSSQLTGWEQLRARYESQYESAKASQGGGMASP